MARITLPADIQHFKSCKCNYKNKRKASRLRRDVALVAMVSLVLSAMAEAKSLGQVTNEPGPQSSRYSINCVSNVENAIILTDPDIKKRYVSDIGASQLPIQKGTDFRAQQIIDLNGQQFLRGQILQYSQGGHIYSIEDPQKTYKERDQFYVLAEQWECRLRKGTHEASCSSDAAIAAYSELYKKYTNECHSNK